MDGFMSIPEPEPDPPNSLTFQAYLQQHQLNPLDVALASGVRYATVWNIAHHRPVRPAHAALVRAELQRLTGVPYTTAMALLAPPEQPSDKRKRR